MAFDFYITKNNKKLRLGYTTGTCAALAVKACCQMLITQKHIESVSVMTPKGMEVEVQIFDVVLNKNECRCCVVKDGGDDIDATDGMKIYAHARKIKKEIIIDGGEGIGRVTKKGLDQPVGSAAINSVPRKMIRTVAEEVAKGNGYRGGFEIIIYAPEGEEISKKTFNQGLGIVHGISIIGSSGIVEPQSLQAISETIKTEIKVLTNEGKRNIIVTPGNYGESFMNSISGLHDMPYVKCSNFIGDTIEYAVEFGIKKALFIGHAGKFVKIAGGIMNTHSALADCRMEILAAHTACFRGEPIKDIMNGVTVDEVIEILDKYSLRNEVMNSIAERTEYHLNRKSQGIVETGAIIFSNKYGLLAIGKNGEKLLEEFGGKVNEG